MVNICLSQLHSEAGQTIVVDLQDDVHTTLKQVGISSLPIRVSQKMDWGRRDSAFRELAMPGKQLDFDIPGTKLPLWKVLSIDRLSFWYRWESAKMEYDLVTALNWNKAFVPLDVNHPLPWALARHSGREVIAVQSGPIRTREIYDLAQSGALPFSAVVHTSGEDAAWLTRSIPNG